MAKKNEARSQEVEAKEQEAKAQEEALTQEKQSEARSKAAQERKEAQEGSFFTQDVENENVKLSESEKAALEVAQGEVGGEVKYKLKDPETSYSDPDFTLAGDQEKPLPEDPSTELIARIRSGFIVKA
ncbi:hypothetical protein [Fictibacillus sp. NRS-1165]|uniref:hypothetical protein n=1 Tax=Fictibacillus sp. NRS-1165 TaxID=3144463 RepID=UPI003D22FA2C